MSANSGFDPKSAILLFHRSTSTDETFLVDFNIHGCALNILSIVAKNLLIIKGDTTDNEDEILDLK